MNTDNFFSEWNGRQVTAYSGECVALVAQYLDENGMHGSIAYANAKDWFTNSAPLASHNRITNNPTDYNQIPSHGDIIIWNGNLPGSGGYGHIAIYDKKTGPGVFQSFDQNWGGRQAHFVSHNYDYILGWYTRKVSTPPSGGAGDIMDTEDKVKRQYNTLRGNEGTPNERKGWVGRPYDEFNQTAVPEINNREQAKRDTQVQIANLTNINNQLNTQIATITADSNATHAEKDAALAQIADLQAQLTTAMDKLKEAQTAPVIPPQDTIQDTRFKQFVKWIKELLNIKEQ